MTESKTPARTKAKPSTPVTGEGSRRASGGMKWWLVLQGDVLEMVESAEMPSTDVKPGERTIRILASYTDKAKADARYALLAPRARGIVGKGVAH